MLAASSAPPVLIHFLASTKCLLAAFVVVVVILAQARLAISMCSIGWLLLHSLDSIKFVLAKWLVVFKGTNLKAALFREVVHWFSAVALWINSQSFVVANQVDSGIDWLCATKLAHTESTCYKRERDWPKNWFSLNQALPQSKFVQATGSHLASLLQVYWKRVSSNKCVRNPDFGQITWSARAATAADAVGGRRHRRCRRRWRQLASFGGCDCNILQ